MYYYWCVCPAKYFLSLNNIFLRLFSKYLLSIIKTHGSIYNHREDNKIKSIHMHVYRVKKNANRPKDWFLLKVIQLKNFEMSWVWDSPLKPSFLTINLLNIQEFFVNVWQGKYKGLGKSVRHNISLLKIKIYFIKIKAFRLTPSSVYDTRKKCLQYMMK